MYINIILMLALALNPEILLCTESDFLKVNFSMTMQQFFNQIKITFSEDGSRRRKAKTVLIWM